ncbi:MAG: tetratricopeptide repeat protein, partial [Chitinophagaceae bacterium]|nr:tetratricopeptide repeat protein [Chitinophagaceae bacterium]
MTQQLLEIDSSKALRFWDSLEIAGQSKGYYFRTRFCMTKVDYLFKRFAGINIFNDRPNKPLAPIKAQILPLYREAIEAAYHTEDDHIIGWASFYSARLMRSLGETGWAVMYSKNGVDLFEKEKYDVEPTVYTWLSELQYEIKEYDESFANAQKAIVAWAKAKDPEYNEKWLQQYHVRAWNSMALNYFTQKNIDSAITNFERALQIARQINDTVWEAKVLGNIGRVLYNQNQFDSAYQLFKKDYYESKAAGMYDNAASAAEWAAKANLAKGNTTAALAEARNAKELLTLWPNRPFLRDTYYSLAQIFRASKNYDSAFYYNDLYIALNDSLEKEVATSSLEISKAKINDEISQFNIQKLKRQKEREIFWRNIIIVAIIVVALIALLIVNRQLLAEKLHKQNAERDKTLLEQEVKAAI